MPNLGPVSTVLLERLLDDVRIHGPVVWLDRDGAYTAFVDRLGSLDPPPFPIAAFRGSHIALMRAVAPHLGGVEPQPLLVHLPGFNEERVADSPALEVYRAGKRFRWKLPTLVRDAAQGRVAPDAIDAVTARPDLTLAEADAWLDALLSTADEDGRQALTGLDPIACFDRLRRDDAWRGRFMSEAGRAGLDAWLAARLGMPADWALGSDRTGASAPRPDELMLSWAQAVEYVSDLHADPADSSPRPRAPLLAPAMRLPPAVVGHCRSLAAYAREKASTFYVRIADETELALTEERASAQAARLGQVDTFRFEESTILAAALNALEQGDWRAAEHWGVPRAEAESVWSTPDRRAAWRLVAAGARLGAALLAAGGELHARTPDDALEHYVAVGAAVDRAHRQVEQHWHRVRTAHALPEHPQIRRAVDALRTAWSAWADRWASDFAAICQREGYLPEPAAQQRTLFDDVVVPLVNDRPGQGPVALFLLDALRFEMVDELLHGLVDARTRVRRRARLAELPTETAVGMNALAPVCDRGRLHPVLKRDRRSFRGLSTGEFQVVGPADRARTIYGKVAGVQAWLSTETVLGAQASTLRKQLDGCRLVVVADTRIDSAGHLGFGPTIFESTLHTLRAAWRRLRSAGVSCFVVTADHGFLMLPPAVQSRPLSHGKKTRPADRHVIGETAVDHPGEQRVALASLGYTGVDGLQLMMPTGIAPFARGENGGPFVHGGNSLQERVIPAVVVEHDAPAGGSPSTWRIEATPQTSDRPGLHRLQTRIVQEQPSLGFGEPSTISVSLAADEDDVRADVLDVRGGQLVGGVVEAPINHPIEIWFALSATRPAAPDDLLRRARVRIAGADQPSERIEHWFEVRVEHRARSEAAQSQPTAAESRPRATQPDDDWLDALPEPERSVYRYLARHRRMAEADVTEMLGSASRFRRFLRRTTRLDAHAPFEVRSEVDGGGIRWLYIR